MSQIGLKDRDSVMGPVNPDRKHSRIDKRGSGKDREREMDILNCTLSKVEV